MDIGTVVSWIQMVVWVVGAAGTAIAYFRRWWRGEPGMPSLFASSRLIWLALGIGLLLSLASLYFNYRPRIVTVEKIVEKPVDRIVPAECPPSKSSDTKPQSSPPQTQSCVGSNCAQSSGQTGGITGQVVIPALNPNDPFPTNSNREVANWALAEAAKIDKRNGDCYYDLDALKNNKVPRVAMDASESATRFSFRVDIQREVPYIRKLHDSMLARLPSLMDQDQEMFYEIQLRPVDRCWNRGDDSAINMPSVSGYLRQMANGLLAHPEPK
jgi:hypothetical protein